MVDEQNAVDQLIFARKVSNFGFIALSVILLIAGILLAIDPDESSEEYVCGIIPLSWFMIIGGIGGIYAGIKESINLPNELDFHIHNDGVSSGERSIAWQDISRIYVEASRTLINLIPSSEKRSITFVSYKGVTIKLELNVGFRMGRRTRKAFDRIYQVSLEHTAQRHWEHFITTLNRGDSMEFGGIEIRADGILYSNPRRGQELLNFDRITGFRVSGGVMVISFIDEKGKLRRSKLGKVCSTPNFHIVSCFLKHVVKVNTESTTTTKV